MATSSAPNSKIVIAPETQALILNTLKDLPHKSWLGDHLTDEQITYWYDLMINNAKLVGVLNDYFQGKDSRARNWDKKTLKLLELERDHLLYFYRMLQVGWEYIEQATKSWGDAALRSAEETVVKLMEIECAAGWEICFTYFPFRKDEAYKLYREEKKLRQLLQSKQQFSASEEQKFQRFLTRVRSLRQPFEQAFWLEEFLIRVCADAAEENSELRTAVENFLDQAQLRDEALMRRLPETQGFAWDGKGNKLQSTQAGGVYK